MPREISRRTRIVWRAVFALLLLLPIGLVYTAKLHWKRDRALIAAIQRNETAAALRLLAQGADPNARTAYRPFRYTLRNLFELVLGHQASGPGDGPPALLLAARQNNTPVFNALLAHGARDVNARDEKGLSILAWAVYHDNTAEMRALVQRGAKDVNARDSAGTPALMMAIRKKDIPLAYALLDQGADPNVKDMDPEYQEDTALIPAAEIGDVSLLNRLFVAGAKMSSAKDADPALDAAAEHGQLEAAKILLAHGARVNNPPDDDYLSRIPILDAAVNNHAEVVELLMAHGARVDAQRGYGTALSYVARAGNRPLVDALLAHRANVNAEADYSPCRTPLFAAALGGHEDVATLLLAHGARLSVEEDDEVESPLLFAAAGGHTDVVNTLLAHGADANTENYAHATALSFAAATGSLRTVDRLLNAGARVDHRDVWGATALMKAAERGHTDCVRALLDHGAAIDSRDHESRTAMMDAAEEGKTAVVRLLLARGAKVSLRGRDDATGATVTALSLAQTCRHPNIVALLRQAGATDILQSKAIARQPKPTAHYLGDPPTYIPPIARIVGVRVGYDSMEDLDRNLGSGVMMMGGHPHGARDWTLLPHGSIDADGFDYSKRGRVIDDLGVIAPLSDEENDKNSSVRRSFTTPPCHTLRWLGRVSLGMTEAEVRRATAHLLPAPKVKEDVWTYTEKGFARLNSQETRHTWTTNLVFQSGRLIQINLDAE